MRQSVCCRLRMTVFLADRDILSALVSFHRDAGNAFAAETYMKKLQKLNR